MIIGQVMHNDLGPFPLENKNNAAKGMKRLETGDRFGALVRSDVCPKAKCSIELNVAWS